MPDDGFQKGLEPQTMMVPFAVTLPASLGRNLIVALKKTLEESMAMESNKDKVASKDNYISISADGLTMNLKDEAGNIFPICSFQTSGKDQVWAVKLEARTIDPFQLCANVNLPASVREAINKARHDQLGEITPGADDFANLYNEIYTKIDNEYKASKLEGKQFAMFLLDKHRDLIKGGFLNDTTIEESEKLFMATQIMALDAYRKITGEEGTKFFMEIRENVLKKEVDHFDDFKVAVDTHMGIVAGNAKQLGFIVIPNETYKLSPENRLTSEIVQIRDTTNNKTFAEQKSNFVGLVGSGHTPSLMGISYDLLEKNSFGNTFVIPTPNPENSICYATHHVMYLNAARDSEFSRSVELIKGTASFLSVHTTIPSTSTNWDMRGMTNVDVQQLAQGTCINNSLRNMEPQEVQKYTEITSLLRMGNPKFDADLMAITGILAKSGLQLSDPKYKEELGQLAQDYIDHKIHDGTYEKDKNNINLIAKKIREL